MKNIALTILILFCCPAIQAQTKPRVLKEKSMITNKEMSLNISGNYRDMTRTKMRSKVISIYRRDSKGLSLGNICAEQVMQMYKCRYEIVPERHSTSRARYFLHNLSANFRLFFENGFFWKARMQKKINKCRELTGDYVEDE